MGILCCHERTDMDNAPQRIEAIFTTWARANAQPTSELVFADPFQLLIAVVLSAQATDRLVNQVTPALFALAPDAAAMAALGEEGIRGHIRRIGLFNTKAKYLDAISRILTERHGGQVPAQREALQALPGVGRKSANVVLNVAFGQPTLAVDTHVFRVAHRLGLADGKTPEAVERALLQVIPVGFLLHAHHWMILHGRHVCKARRPVCSVCLVANWCPYVSKSGQG